jgi:hypothetical protein
MTYSKEELLRMGRSELRAVHGLQNASAVSDEFLIDQIEQFADDVEAYIGADLTFEPNTPEYNSVRYYGLIRASFYDSIENGPSSVSHALRYDYDDYQLRFWRSRLQGSLLKI